MALVSGQSSQIGFARETTPGTPVTVTTFLPLVDESITEAHERLESAGIIAGRRIVDSDQWNGGPVTIEGDVQLELSQQNMGLLLKSALGANSTTGGGNPYTHTITPGDLSDDSLTIQVGRPGVGGTVHPFTFRGCAITSWELACQVNEIVTFGASIAAMGAESGSRVVIDGVTNTDTTLSSATAAFTSADIGKRVSGTGITAGSYIVSITSATAVVLSAATTATDTGVSITIGTALASASYNASLLPYKFNHGTVSIGGSTASVKGITLSGDNMLDTDRRFIGSETISQPLEAGLREYTGTIDVEFSDLTQTNRFLNGDEFAVVLTLTGSSSASATITLNARFDGADANVSDTALLQQSLPYKVIGDGSDADGITIALLDGVSSI